MEYDQAGCGCAGHTHDVVIEDHEPEPVPVQCNHECIPCDHTRCQLQIDALRQQGVASRHYVWWVDQFNWWAAGATALVGFLIWLFWFLPHDFGGKVVDQAGNLTGGSIGSQLDTWGGNAFGLVVVALWALAAGWFFARDRRTVTE